MGGEQEGTNRPPIRVVIVDDSEVLIEALVAMMSMHPGVEVVASALDGDEATATVAEVRPDAVLLDLRLGDRWGLDLVPDLRAGDSPPAVVVFSAASDPDIRESALRAGAQGHVTKGAPVEEIVGELLAVARDASRGADAQS